MEANPIVSFALSGCSKLAGSFVKLPEWAKTLLGWIGLIGMVLSLLWMGIDYKKPGYCEEFLGLNKVITAPSLTAKARLENMDLIDFLNLQVTQGDNLKNQVIGYLRLGGQAWVNNAPSIEPDITTWYQSTYSRLSKVRPSQALEFHDDDPVNKKHRQDWAILFITKKQQKILSFIGEIQK